jgi:hypothetical protein
MTVRPTTRLHRALRPALVVCLLAGCAAAQAQWVWRDAAGNTTFSDAPPPADVKPEAILRRPDAPAQVTAAPTGPVYDGGQVAPEPPKAAPGAGAPAAKAAAGPKTLAEQEADFRKRRDERLKAEQKDAEDQAKAQQKAAACSQARSYLDMVQSGVRLMRPNPDGTRGYVDDEGRAAEVQKAQQQIDQNCS